VILVVEARDAHEEARAEWVVSARNETVAENRARRQVLQTLGDRHLDGEVNVEVVNEKLGVPGSLLLHDGAIHGVVSVDENTKFVRIDIESNLATVLPLPIHISAAGRAGAGNATVLALVFASIQRVSDATKRLLAINTGEGSAINAVVVAVYILTDIGFASTTLRSTGVLVAVGPASLALEHAVTTGSKVGRVTVAVWYSAVVNMAKSEGVGILGGDAEEVFAIEWNVVSREDGLARLIVRIEATIAEVAESRRAAVGLGATREGSGRLTNLTPAANVFATVTGIIVAILVIVYSTIVHVNASGLVRASASTRCANTTLAEDLTELLGVDVVLLSNKREPSPSRAIP